MQKPIYTPGGYVFREVVRTEYTGRTASRKVLGLWRVVTVEVRQIYEEKEFRQPNQQPVRVDQASKTFWRDAAMNDLIAMGEQLRAIST